MLLIVGFLFVVDYTDLMQWKLDDVKKVGIRFPADTR